MASADADEREIRAILSRALSYGAGEDMYKHWGECIIRPSGNPMNSKMFEEMMTGGDVVNRVASCWTLKSSTLASIWRTRAPSRARSLNIKARRTTTFSF